MDLTRACKGRDEQSAGRMEIHDARNPVRGEQHVARFQIAVDYSLSVQVAHDIATALRGFQKSMETR